MATSASSPIRSARRSTPRSQCSSEQLTTLPTGSTARADALSTLQQLQSATAAVSGGAQVIGSAGVPSDADRPEAVGAVVLAGIVGLVVGLAVVFVLESIDRRLGSIEASRGRLRDVRAGEHPRLVVQAAHSGPARPTNLEPYRILRSSLDFAAVNRPVHTLLVTSAVSGEGKTTVSVDLAQHDRAHRTPRHPRRGRSAPADVRQAFRPRSATRLDDRAAE